MARWNWWLAARAALAGLKRAGRRERVLMIQTPGLLPTLTGLDADLTAYLIVDDYAGLADPRSRAGVARAHRALARAADLVWAVSLPLAEEARSHRSVVHLTTHGVDVAAFEAAARLPTWPLMADLPPPRVGALGKLNDRIDWDLVESIAAARPGWNLVFVGPLYLAGEATLRAVERLRRRPNVHFLPEVAPAEIPRVMQALDVGLILYRPGIGTAGINPLKLYQYLAAGKPVVSMPLPAVLRFEGAARVAENAAEFLAAIEAALGSRDAADEVERRRALAHSLDWNRIAADRLEAIRASLAGGTASTGA